MQHCRSVPRVSVSTIVLLVAIVAAMCDPRLAELELAACSLEQVRLENFNRRTVLPYGLTVDHIAASMNEFINFLGFINVQLNGRSIPRFEAMLMPANFSCVVSEFMSATIPTHCPGLVKNRYHNGHPDLIPAGRFPGEAVQHAQDGIEIKGSRYLRGWQGHNAEDAWLMVFCYESGRPTDGAKNIAPAPFRFLAVVGAQLAQADWTFSGRSETSRRTITASVNGTGYAKMTRNWIYKAPGLQL